MAIDVIIPLYNGSPWIAEALDSVFTQEAEIADVVVVDDGSNDDGPRKVRAYDCVKMLKNNGKGSSVARNLGMEHSGSEFVAFLDQDDLWHPLHLQRLLTALEAEPEARAAVSQASCFEGDGPEYDAEPTAVAHFDPWTRYPFTIGIEGPSVALLRRAAVDDAGRWEKCATGMGDILMFLKMAVHHPVLKHAARTTGKRIHASQQWLQVRELGAAYLGDRHDVTQRALDFRRDVQPHNPKLEAYAARQRALLCLKDLTRAIQDADWGEVADTATLLEQHMAGESELLLRHMYYCLMGALFFTYKADELRRDRDATFGRLLDVWPEQAPRTRAVMADLIGEQPVVS